MKLERVRKDTGTSAVASDFPELPNITTESWLKPHPRFRLQRLVVPVDFSAQSERALQYALSIAEEFQSDIILVHVVQLYPIMAEFPAATPDLNASLIKQARGQLEKLAARINTTSCRVVALGGSPAREVVALAEKEHADLIILGTHGRTGVAHAFLGSVAEKIVRLAPCPTLVVREHERDFVVANADDPAVKRTGGRQLRVRK